MTAKLQRFPGVYGVSCYIDVAEVAYIGTPHPFNVTGPDVRTIALRGGFWTEVADSHEVQALIQDRAELVPA